MSTLKRFRVKNCPAINICDCENTVCIWKNMFKKPKDRMDYVKNKLSGCYGYSQPEKLIRYEELDWCLKEFCNIMDVEVANGTDSMDKES